MRTIIAGPRTYHKYETLLKAIEEAAKLGIVPTLVLSGKANGVDALGEQWAKENGLQVEEYPAKWNDLTHPAAVIKRHPGHSGKRYDAMAGIRRNAEMAEAADALVAIWDGKTRGTRNMIDQMYQRSKRVYWRRTE